MSRMTHRLEQDTLPITLPHANGQPRPRQADQPADRKAGGFNHRPVQLEQEEEGYAMRPVQLGANRRKSMTRKISSRTPTSTIGWIRVSTLAWSKQLTQPTHGLGVASTAWRKVIAGGSALSYPYCLSCRKYSIERL